jgi:hypothetical protein
MESARSVIENARIKIAMLMAAGAIALGASGCTSPDEAEKAQATAEAVAEAKTPVYATFEGADALPDVDKITSVPEASYVNDFISSTALNVAVENEPKKNKYMDTYNSYTNPTPEGKPEGDHIDGDMGNYAPVLDFMINSKGKLVYEDFTPDNGISDEEEKIIRVVEEKSNIIEPAMRSGDVGKLHFAVGEPSSQGDPEYPTGSFAQFIPTDYNDGGKPSVYFGMEGVEATDTETVEVVLGHEFEHAMLKQGGEYSAEDKVLLNSACNSLRDNALENIHENSDQLVAELRAARSSMKAAYKPAMSRVINAIERETYGDMPTSIYQEKLGMPECFVQSPWDAYLQQARQLTYKSKALRENIGGPSKDSPQESENFNEAMQSAFATWNTLTKEGKVHFALNESSYLESSEDNDRWGHTTDGTDELTATLTNLIEEVPEELGKNVADLQADEKASILRIAERNIQKLLLTHQNEPEYQKHIGDQYGVFLMHADIIPTAPIPQASTN